MNLAIARYSDVQYLFVIAEVRYTDGTEVARSFSSCAPVIMNGALQRYRNNYCTCKFNRLPVLVSRNHFEIAVPTT